MTTKILILHVEAGYGHRKVAESIAEELRSRKNTDVVVEVSDALQRTDAPFKKNYAKIYFNMVKWVPWLWGFLFYFTNLPFFYIPTRPLRTLWNWFHSKELRAYLQNQKFDFILFTHFFPAEVCATLKRKKLIDSTLITVVTDVIPHAVWQNRGTDVYWTMSEEGKDALLKRDPSLHQIHAGGIPIGPVFNRQEDAPGLRRKFGLQDNLFTILFTSGSFGIGPTEEVLERLEEWHTQIQVMVVCGTNKTLYATLNQKKHKFPLVLFGLVDNMYELMSVTDLLLAKPGGATMCESLAKGVPMFIMSPIPGQETYNASWLVNHGAAYELKQPSDIARYLPDILNNPQTLSALRQSVKKIAKPQAASEVANFILEKMKQ